MLRMQSVRKEYDEVVAVDSLLTGRRQNVAHLATKLYLPNLRGKPPPRTPRPIVTATTDARGCFVLRLAHSSRSIAPRRKRRMVQMTCPFEDTGGIAAVRRDPSGRRASTRGVIRSSRSSMPGPKPEPQSAFAGFSPRTSSATVATSICPRSMPFWCPVDSAIAKTRESQR